MIELKERLQQECVVYEKKEQVVKDKMSFCFANYFLKEIENVIQKQSDEKKSANFVMNALFPVKNDEIKDPHLVELVDLHELIIKWRSNLDEIPFLKSCEKILNVKTIQSVPARDFLKGEWMQQIALCQKHIELREKLIPALAFFCCGAFVASFSVIVAFAMVVTAGVMFNKMNDKTILFLSEFFKAAESVVPVVGQFFQTLSVKAERMVEQKMK